MNFIGPLLVKSISVSWCKVTWLFWCAWMNLFGKCVSIVVYAHFFLPDKTFILLKCAHTFFMIIFRIYAHLTVSIQSLFMQYSKMCIKIGGWKCSYWSRAWSPPFGDWAAGQYFNMIMTTALLKKLRVKAMDWPSVSPDLNPIEHLWGILKRKVEEHKVSNIHQLRDAIMEEWKRTPANLWSSG